MSNLTYAELLRRAKACDTCGNEHKQRTGTDGRPTWADPADGHAYSQRSSHYGKVAEWLERQSTQKGAQTDD